MAKETPDNAQFEFSDRQQSAFLFLISFLVFALTSAHSATFEDSGLFISTIKVLGLPQPPGYPLYILLGHIFSYLPFGSLAYRVHLLSNLLGAGTAIFIFLSLRQLKTPKWSAFFSSLAVITSSTMWSQSIVAEVYPLHIFIFAALFYLSLLILEASAFKNVHRLQRLYIIFGLTLGLGFANHWPLLVMGLPLILAFVWPIKADIFKQSWKWLGAALITSGVFYALMMWRSNYNPVISFLGPIDSVGELIGYINRSYYRVIENNWTSTVYDNFYFFGEFILGLLWKEWYLVGAVFIIGCLNAYKKFSKVQMMGLLFGLFATPIVLPIQLPFEFNDLNQNVLKVFHLVSFFTAGLILPCGFEYIRKNIPKYFIAISTAVLTLTIVLNFIRNDLRTDYFAEDYARVVLELIPKGEDHVPLIAGTDADVGPLSYIRYGLGERPDIDLYTQSGVFFSNRIFDPWIFTKNVRIEKTESFLNDHASVYSTKALDILEGLNNLPYVFNYNGIFYEVSKSTLRVEPTNPAVLSMIRRALNDYMNSPHESNWHYYREVIAARLCNVIVLTDTSDEFFEKIKACRLVKARRFHMMKLHEQADQLFVSLIDDSKGMIAAERHMLRHLQLINKLEWINSTSQSFEQKNTAFAEAVEYAAPALDDFKDCKNGVLTVIRSLAGRITMSLELQNQLREFDKKCGPR